MGQFAEAVLNHEQARALAREIGYRQGEAITLVNIGHARSALGNAHDATLALQASLVLCQEIGALYPQGYALFGLGSVAAQLGDAAIARARLQESIELRRRIGHQDGLADSLFELAALGFHEDRPGEAHEALAEAIALQRELGRAPELAAALALDAASRCDAASVAAADAAGTAVDPSEDSPRLRLLLFRATEDARHLHEAKRLLDELLAKNPPEYHDSMCNNVRVNREILSAWREEFGDDDEPHDNESITRVG